jgi:2-hydroxychromene-2-carboxylate isomerase
MSSPITLYLDLISPYAYLAWKAARPLAQRHQRALRPVPILFAALLDHHGQKGPAEIGPKRIYTFKHVTRLAAQAGLPLAPPPSHPFNPLTALRVASLALPDAERDALLDALFDATWGGGDGVETPEKVIAAAGRAGLDGAHLLAEASTPESKGRLRSQTDEALTAGVFGVPTWEVDGELFWGYDAIPHVELFLQGRDPVDPAALLRWKDLPASAERRR